MTWRHSILLAFVLLLVAASSNATSIILTPWEVMLQGADFVGLVECNTAGSGTSEYKVIEVWKGTQKAGSTIRIHFHIEASSNQPTVATVGNRYLVAAKSPTIKTEEKPLIEAILQRRLLPAELDTICFCSTDERIRQERTILTSIHSRKHALKYSQISRATKDFLTLTDEMQEAFFMRCTIEAKQCMLKERAESLVERQDASVISQLNQDIKRTKNLKDTIDAIVHTQSKLRGDETKDFAKEVISEAGKHTLALLQTNSSWTIPKVDELIHKLRSNERHDKLNAAQTAADTEFSAAKLDAVEIEWKQKDLTSLECISEDLKLLIAHRPQAVTARLIKFELPNKNRFSGELTSYGLISFFGYHCRSDRQHFLEQLLNAKDPVIRTGAAVYLCSEDPELGLKALEECADLPGAAGSWATIALTCRGRKDAVPKALKALSIKEDFYNPELQTVWDKRGQLLALLSNSAKASGVPQPTAPYDRWWKKYGDKITLHDPWLAEMDRLKID